MFLSISTGYDGATTFIRSATRCLTDGSTAIFAGGLSVETNYCVNTRINVLGRGLPFPDFSTLRPSVSAPPAGPSPVDTDASGVGSAEGAYLIFLDAFNLVGTSVSAPSSCERPCSGTLDLDRHLHILAVKVDPWRQAGRVK